MYLKERCRVYLNKQILASTYMHTGKEAKQANRYCVYGQMDGRTDGGTDGQRDMQEETEG